MTGFIVLNFHGIGAPERALDPGEAPYWLETSAFGRILDRIAAHPCRDRIRLTFDDGNRSDGTVAMPMLRDRGLTADFFVLTGRLDMPGSLSRDDIGHLLEAGMGVGSHGIAHLDWARLSAKALCDELVGSRAELEAICGLPVTSAGIPFGSYSRTVLRALRNAGYEVAYSSDTGVTYEHHFPRARTSVRRDWPESMLDSVLDGRVGILKEARRRVARAYRRWAA